MFRLLMALTFGFMTLWHGPAMALSALNASPSHHGNAADVPADHRHHAPASPSDAAAPCPILSCCIALAAAPAMAAIPLSPAAPPRSDVAVTIVADDPAPPVPPPRDSA